MRQDQYMCSTPDDCGSCKSPRLENRTTGHKWLKQFLEHNSKYYVQKEKPPAVEPKCRHSVYDMSNYIEKLLQVIKEKEITDLDT